MIFALPQGVRAPRWSGETVLLYVGALVLLGAILSLLDQLGKDGSAERVGWTSLVLAVVAGLAVVFRRFGHGIAAGLLATILLVTFSSWVEEIEQWSDFLPSGTDSTFTPTYEPGNLVVALVTVAAGLLLLRAFRFSLLLLPVALALLYELVDLGTLIFGSDVSDSQRALLAALAGASLVAWAIRLDRSGESALAFWPHAIGGLALAIATLVHWHSSDGDWALVLVIALLFVLAARWLWRSSYAVYGVLGLFTASSYFIGKILEIDPSGLLFGVGPGVQGDGVEASLHYVLVGLGIVLIGVFFRRGTWLIGPRGRADQ